MKMAGCCVPREGREINGIDNADWMAYLPDKLHNVPLNCIAIPGTHDSFSFYLDEKGGLAPDSPPFVKDLVKIFGNTVINIILKWSLTQELQLTGQLKSGIRYFDVRVTTKPGSEGLYSLHGLYGEKIEPGLREVNQFLDEHPKEVVLLDFNHFYNVTKEQHVTFISLIMDVFKGKLCPFLDMGSTTLEQLWDNGLQVIVFYQNPVIGEYMELWPGSQIESPWPNTGDLNTAIKFLDARYQQGRPKDIFNVSQGVLTPNTSMILSHPLSTLREVCAKKMDKSFCNWLKDKQAGRHGINICIVDYFELDSYVACVLNLNHK